MYTTGGRVGWSDLVVDIGVLGADVCLDLPRLGQPCLGVVVPALLNSGGCSGLGAGARLSTTLASDDKLNDLLEAWLQDIHPEI